MNEDFLVGYQKRSRKPKCIYKHALIYVILHLIVCLQKYLDIFNNESHVLKIKQERHLCYFILSQSLDTGHTRVINCYEFTRQQ